LASNTAGEEKVDVVGETGPGCKKLDPIIVADHIKKTFGGLVAVDVAHIEIPRNRITALIGPNGAGKSTLFNLLTGFDQPDSGEWYFDGTPLAGRAPHALPEMGLVRTFQLTKVLGLLTVMENMKLAARNQIGEKIIPSLFSWLWRKQEAELEIKAAEILERFKLHEKKDDFAAGLSGGQRKLLEMARALMVEPRLVMLDEPMAGVNPALTESLLHHISDLKAHGMTVLFVEHDMAMVRNIADWVIVMAEGKIVAEGEPHAVLKNPAVVDAYLGSHQDVDLGVATGRVTLPASAPQASTSKKKTSES
jgi:neutral amino acid transport system ATP-binding protein